MHSNLYNYLRFRRILNFYMPTIVSVMTLFAIVYGFAFGWAIMSLIGSI